MFVCLREDRSLHDDSPFLFVDLAGDQVDSTGTVS